MLENLKIKIFADGANLHEIQKISGKNWIQGFTTNPTLMRHSGVKDYLNFAKEAIRIVGNKPISFEVFADDFPEMERQAFEIASWGPNVYVKIPVTNTKGESSSNLIRHLSEAGILVNVTALFTFEQVKEVVDHLSNSTPSIISIFCGRIADTGRDPTPLVKRALQYIEKKKNMELLWASPRELLNLIQANDSGCHIITLPEDLLKKVPSIGKDLTQFSLETVQMFYRDAIASDFKIPLNVS